MARRRGASVAAPPPLEPTVALVAEARARWDIVAPLLALRGPIDRERLTAYCQVWGRWRIAENGLAKSGPLLRSKNGNPRPNPLISISNQAAARLKSLERELRLEEALAAPVPAGSPADRLLTRRELAEALAVHMQTITKWERDGMPIAARGGRGRSTTYRVGDVELWRLQRDRAATGATGAGGVDAAADRARRDRAQAELVEQTIAVRAKELLPRADVARVWAAEVAAIRALLLAWPTTIADRLARAATLEGVAGVEGVLNVEVRTVLNQLADPSRPVSVPGS